MGKGRHRRRSPVRAAALLAAGIFAAGGLGSWVLSRDSAPPQALPVAAIIRQVEDTAARLPHPVPAKPRPVIADVQSYVVRPGDTLSSIAAAHCPTPGWGPLWRANRAVVPHPDEIREGQVLVIAC